MNHQPKKPLIVAIFNYNKNDNAQRLKNNFFQVLSYLHF